VRIAEFVNLDRDFVGAALDEYDRLADDEGQAPYDYDGNSGAALLFDEMERTALRCLDRGDAIPTILRCVVGKAFRMGSHYGRATVAPECRE